MKKKVEKAINSDSLSISHSLSLSVYKMKVKFGMQIRVKVLHILKNIENNSKGIQYNIPQHFLNLIMFTVEKGIKHFLEFNFPT